MIPHSPNQFSGEHPTPVTHDTSLTQHFPTKHARISNRNSPFITPDIKKLLRRKNTLVRRGKVKAANRIESLICEKIIKANSRILCGEKRGSKELWKTVNQCLGKNDRSEDNVNAIFHDIKCQVTQKTFCWGIHRTECVFHVGSPRETSSGLDGLPFWYLHLAAASISAPLQYIFNQCLRQSFVPKQWKTALITPVPNASKPVACQDYRPISVTPISSKLFEKAILREFLHPVLVHDSCRALYDDQYAFRPTGSITATLINLVKDISDLLIVYPYVHLITFKICKAFDSIRHRTLMDKLADLPISTRHIIGWLNIFRIDVTLLSSGT